MFYQHYDHQTKEEAYLRMCVLQVLHQHKRLICLYCSKFCICAFDNRFRLYRSDDPVALPYVKGCLAVSGSNQAYRAISTSQLKALPLLHLWPIDVVVFHGSQGRPCFEGGFPLRCLQRLSCPFIATQHCRWHDNWSTSGTFTPVLSY